MTRECGFREIVAGALLLLFAWAFYMDPSNGSMQGAVLTAFATAYGFYLGGSKVGSDTATKNADTLSSQAAANTQTTEPQQVEVVNEADQPVPTTDSPRVPDSVAQIKE